MKDADRIKANFLATVSHELRTPLTVILGYCRFAHRLPAEAHARITAIIERNALGQLRIVDDLLDLSRIQSGRLTFGTNDRQTFDTGRSAKLERFLN